MTEYVYITEAADARRHLARLLEAPVLGFDTETTGLDPHADRLRLAALAPPEGPVRIFDLFRVDPRLLAPIFAPKGPLLVGHNLKFDLKFLIALLGEDGLPGGRRFFDTMLAAQLLKAGAEPAGRTPALRELVRELLGEDLDKSLKTSDFSGPLAPQQLAYAAADARAALRLYEPLSARLREAGLERTADLEMRALPGVAWLEFAGTPLDARAWTELARRAGEELAAAEAELNRLAGQALGANTLFGFAADWDSPKQALSVLKAAGVPAASTAEAELSAHREHPLVAALLRYRDAARRAQAYGEAFLRFVHPRTGRVHPEWRQLGSAAGRMSCEKPNLQQLPRDPAYRRAVAAPPGRCLVRADYSQIELRIAAEIAPDPRMAGAYIAGRDLHELTARLVLNVEGPLPPGARQTAKAVNFGLIYGMSPEGLRRYAAWMFGVRLSESEACSFHRRFFQTYAGIARWHRRVREAAPEGEPVETRTLSGRRRLGVTRFTERLNSPVQGTGADGLKAALALLWETRHRAPGTRPVLAVHDELVVEAPADPDAAGRTRAWLEECMLRGMGAFLKTVPVQVESHWGPTWAG